MTDQPDVMTLSRLIRELQAIRQKHGDLRVYVRASDIELFEPILHAELMPDFEIADVGKREVVLIE